MALAAPDLLLPCFWLAAATAWDRVTVVYPPAAGAEALLRALLPPSVHLAAQAGDGLGAALTEAFQSHLDAGHAPAGPGRRGATLASPGV